MEWKYIFYRIKIFYRMKIYFYRIRIFLSNANIFLSNENNFYRMQIYFYRILLHFGNHKPLSSARSAKQHNALHLVNPPLQKILDIAQRKISIKSPEEDIYNDIFK